MPALYTSEDMSHATLIPLSDASVSVGSGWTASTQGINQTAYDDFYETSSASTAGNISLTFTGKEVGLYRKTKNNYGVIAWDVDSGSTTGTNNFYGGTSFGFAGYSMLTSALSDTSHSITLDPQAGSGGEESLAIAGVLVLPTDAPTAWETWQSTHFSGTSDPDAASTADPDSDGIVNFNEFALNTNPTTADDLSGKTTLSLHENSGSDYLQFSYIRRKGTGTGDTLSGYTLDGITYTVEISEDLVNWRTGAKVIEAIGSPSDNGDGTETVTVRSKEAFSADKDLYMRLKVSQ